MNKDILLCTLNSTFQHAAFGLRYLKKNLGPLSTNSHILEFTIKENHRTIVEKVLSYSPKIVGFGVYIWNSHETLQTISILKKVSPQTVIVLGGPEISHETEKQALFQVADFVIKGESDFSFRRFCENFLINNKLPEQKIIPADLPDIKSIELPYDLYTDEDIKNRLIYVEVSRGCPYKCEYCLSSLDKQVRSFNLEIFLAEMQKLLDRGAKTFKFVDRTFNLSSTTSTTILKFFLDQIELGLFLHFEMVPDRLPDELKELIRQFPPGALQFEVGIQTLNPEVSRNISRKNDLTKVAENFKFLKEQTTVHSHADLIVGLPGEDLNSFAVGFDRLQAMGPNEIQVGILKRLKGTPIARHEKTFQMIYSDYQPFQILSTSTMDYQTLQKMNRFAKFWDLYANSGQFKEFMKWFLKQESYFWSFFNFSEHLSTKFSEIHSLSLMTLAEEAWLHLLQQEVDKSEASEIILKDYSFGAKRRDIPTFLKDKEKSLPAESLRSASFQKGPTSSSLNKRQRQHLR